MSMTATGGRAGKKSKKGKSGAPGAMQIRLAKAFPTVFRNVDVSAAAPGITAPERARPTLPRVNMLPPGRMLDVRRRALIRRFAIAGSALGLGALSVWAIQGATISTAASGLDATQAQIQATLRRVTQLKPVGQYFDNLQDRMNVGAAAFMEQIDYGEVTDQIMAAVPEGVTVGDIEMHYVSPTGETPPDCGTDSAGQPPATRPIGCITFVGTAVNLESLTVFIRNVAKVDGLINPFVAPASGGNTTADGRTVFNGAAGINPSVNVADAVKSLVDVSGVEGLTPPDPAGAAKPASGDGAQASAPAEGGEQ